MTILDHPTPTAATLDVHDKPVATGPNVHCEQIVHDATGERPQWVSYDPDLTAAVVHLWHPTASARFLLGLARYRHNQTLPTGELWERPAQHVGP